jgi:hypothetical protein
MMGQAFSLRVLFRLQPKAAAAKATLPWARMDEALGLAGGDAEGLMGDAAGLAGNAAGLMGMKAVGLGHRRGTGRRGHNRAARAVHRERLPSLEWLDSAPLTATLAGPVSGVRCPVSGVRCPVSGVRCPVSGVRCPVSGVREWMLDGGA